MQSLQINNPFNYYIILNGFFNNSGINWTSSNELHERSECNSFDRVQFIPELLKKPVNMYIIKWDSYIPWFEWDMKNIRKTTLFWGLKFFWDFEIFIFCEVTNLRADAIPQFSSYNVTTAHHFGETEEIVISDYPLSNNSVILYHKCDGIRGTRKTNNKQQQTNNQFKQQL